MKSQRDLRVQIHCGSPSGRQHLENESPAASGIPLERKLRRGLTTIQQAFVQLFLFLEGVGEVRLPLPALICNNAPLDVSVEDGVEMPPILAAKVWPTHGVCDAVASVQRSPQTPTPALNLPVGPHHHFKRARQFSFSFSESSPHRALRRRNYLWPLGQTTRPRNKDCCHRWKYFRDPL